MAQIMKHFSPSDRSSNGTSTETAGLPRLSNWTTMLRESLPINDSQLEVHEATEIIDVKAANHNSNDTAQLGRINDERQTQPTSCATPAAPSRLSGNRPPTGRNARRRALRPVGGLLPDKRDGAAGVAQEVGCVCRSSLIRPSCAVSLLL